jgi:hypothetical protein
MSAYARSARSSISKGPPAAGYATRRRTAVKASQTVARMMGAVHARPPPSITEYLAETRSDCRLVPGHAARSRGPRIPGCRPSTQVIVLGVQIEGASSSDQRPSSGTTCRCCGWGHRRFLQTCSTPSDAYTLATGELVFTGQRTRVFVHAGAGSTPSSTSSRWAGPPAAWRLGPPSTRYAEAARPRRRRHHLRDGVGAFCCAWPFLVGGGSSERRGAELDPTRRSCSFFLPPLVRPGGDPRAASWASRATTARGGIFAVPAGTDLFLLAAPVAYPARRREQHRAGTGRDRAGGWGAPAISRRAVGHERSGATGFWASVETRARWDGWW